MKNKKGNIIEYLSLWGFIIAMIVFFMAIQKWEDKTKNFGQYQLQLLDIYQQGEKAAFYSDESAKLSAEEAIYKLGEKGGYSSDGGCGYTEDGYILWQYKGKECYPTVLSLENSYKEQLNDLMLQRALAYPAGNVEFPEGYELTVYRKDGALDIKGIPKTDLKINSREMPAKETDYNELIYPKPGEKGIRFDPSPNYNSRYEKQVSMIIIHYTAGSKDAAISWLKNPKAMVSAHYVVGKDGEIVQLVEEKYRAWHAGYSNWQGETDINAISIGVEVENDGKEPYPDAQMKALAKLVAEIRKRYDIPQDRVFGHSDVSREGKIDPGKQFNWAMLRSDTDGFMA